MNFDQLIQYKTLDRIHSLSGSDLVDRVSVPEDQKAQMKNVCALIHVSLFEELESTCGLLGLSKRQFIEACLIEGLAKTDQIVEDLGLYEQVRESHGHGSTKLFPTEAEVIARDPVAKGRSK